jgi:two-component system sensor histidine kinase PhoQ
MNSLRARVVAVASLVLAAFLGVTAVALERAFHDTGLELVRERLQAQIYALLAAADPDSADRLHVDALAEPRFTLPESGLYALVREAGGEVLWRSGSLLGRDLALAAPAAAGDPVFATLSAPWGERLFALSYRVRWELAGNAERVFDVHVAESRSGFENRVELFRRDLWGWLAGLALILLLAQALVLTWGLAPLRRLSAELREVESGQRDALSEDQPEELRALAGNMNQLIAFGRRTIERHRNALADLAHGLKTPLAVLRGAAEDGADLDPALRSTLLESVTRMDETLSYRLRRASAAGGGSLAAPVDVVALVGRLRESMLKVYAGKELRVTVDAAPGLQARADAGDLTEILGNLLDNACKWARTGVWIRASGDPSGRGFTLRVEDDGPGIPRRRRARMLERGVRGDEQVSGQGIGLSLVRGLAVEHYGGSVAVDESEHGGTRVTVRLDVPVR